MKYLWPAPGNHVTLAKLDKLRKEFKVPDDWVIEADETGFHLQHPDQSRYRDPAFDPGCECLCHRGKEADHIWNKAKPICPHCGERAPI